MKIRMILIASGAVRAAIGFGNLGASGSVAYKKPSHEVVRGWITEPCNARPPEAAGADPESLADARPAVLHQHAAA